MQRPLPERAMPAILGHSPRQPLAPEPPGSNRGGSPSPLLVGGLGARAIAGMASSYCETGHQSAGPRASIDNADVL